MLLMLKKLVNIKLTSWYSGEERTRTADLLTASLKDPLFFKNLL